MTEMILLSEAQMARISPFFPLSHGIPRVDDRRVIGGNVLVILNGLRWSDVPPSYLSCRSRTCNRQFGKGELYRVDSARRLAGSCAM